VLEFSLEPGIIPQHPGRSGTPGHVDLNRERMIVVKKLIALLILVGMLTMAIGCNGGGTTPGTGKTGGSTGGSTGGGTGGGTGGSTGGGTGGKT